MLATLAGARTSLSTLTARRIATPAYAQKYSHGAYRSTKKVATHKPSAPITKPIRSLRTAGSAASLARLARRTALASAATPHNTPGMPRLNQS